MIRREFEQLRFKDVPKDKILEVTFLDHFYFQIPYEDLKILGEFKADKNSFEFERKEQKFDFMISNGFNNLKSRITGKKTVYVHANSGIPLVGNGSFGIVDRGTNVIEIKPICGCNIDCVYCSVDENKRAYDFVVEKDYLIEELKKVVIIKDKPVEVHIGCQGEPLLYSQLTGLIKDSANIKGVTKVSIDTNVTLLNEAKVDELISAGLTQFNSSLNATQKERANHIANAKYNLDHVLKIIRYIGTKDVKQVIAPVWVQGLNDEDIEPIIKLCKETGSIPGIQNYLSYSFGKKVGKTITMEDFYNKLHELEAKHDIKLHISLRDDFGIVQDNELAKPFKKNDVIDADLICIGRFNNEFIAVAKDRSMSVYDNTRTLDRKIGQRIKVRIIRSKHNIFAGEPA